MVPHHSLKIWRWVTVSLEVRSGKKKKRKEKEHSAFYKLKRSRFASTNAHKGKAFK